MSDDRIELTAEEAKELREAFDDESEARQVAEIAALQARAEFQTASLSRFRVYTRLAHKYNADTTSEYSFEGNVLTKKTPR